VIVRKRLRDESPDTATSCDNCESFEQERGHTFSMMIVSDRERDFQPRQGRP
jgi:hypothetical protein